MPEKIFKFPEDKVKEFIKRYSNEYRTYELKKLPIDKLVQDNDLLDDEGLESYHEENWDWEKAKDFTINQDLVRVTPVGEIPYVTENNDKLELGDGRHRVRALYNDGYTHVILPVTVSLIREELQTKEDVLKEIDRIFGQTEPYFWSTYILPNGHFLNPNTDNAQEYWKEVESEPVYEHEDFIYFNKLGEDVFEDCIKVNVTYPYVYSPENGKMTNEQCKSLQKLLDYGKDFFEYSFDEVEERVFEYHNDVDVYKMEQPLLVLTPHDEMAYDLSIYSGSDIAKKIQKSYISGVLEEELNKNTSGNTFKFKNKYYWSGSVNVLDGVIEEVHTYKEAKNHDFHHTMYFSENQVEKMDNDECVFFYIDEDNEIHIDPIGRTKTFDEMMLKSKIKEQIKFLNTINESTQEKLYHGSMSKFDVFNQEINWITPDIYYAKYYATALSDKGYIYTVEASLDKLFDMGKTGYRVYNLYPVLPPFKVSDRFLELIKSLNLTEKELNELLQEVTEEWGLEANGYKMKFSTVARSTPFKKILMSKGYRGVKAIEYNIPKNRECNTYGIFNKSEIKIVNVEEVEYSEKLYNESLLESKQDKENFKNWIANSDIVKDMSSQNKESYVNSFVDEFEEFRNNVKAPYNDYYYWIKQNDFMAFTKFMQEQRNSKESKMKAKEGAELLYSDKDWKVYKIDTYEASEKYGKGTKWCISGSKRWANGQNGERFFKDYHDEHEIDFYFFIGKDDKYAIALYPNNIVEIFNSADVKVPYIPNAPEVKELSNIKYRKETISNDDLIVHAVTTDKLPHDLLFELIEEIAYENQDYDDVIITENVNEFCDTLNEFIPDGYLEFELVLEGKYDKQKYIDEFGIDPTETQMWDGDYPRIDMGDLGDYIKLDKTKEELCNPNNYSKYKFFELVESYGDMMYRVHMQDSFSELLLYLTNLFGVNFWNQEEYNDFFEEDEIRADVPSVMIANELIYNITQGKIKNWQSMLKSFGCSDEYIKEINKAIKQQKDMNNHSNGLFTESLQLNEMKGKEIIKDKEILDIIEDCKTRLGNIGYYIGDDIDYMWGDAAHTFGTLISPTSAWNPNYTLVLNKYMKDEPRETIENTILHEFTHYIERQDLFDAGIIYIDEVTGKLMGTKEYFQNKSLYSSHGKYWQRLADNISKRLNLEKPITSTDTYEFHKGVGQYKDSKIKYVVTCDNCGNEMKFMKKTDFVKNPNIYQYDYLVNSKDGDYYYDYYEKHPDKKERAQKTQRWSCGSCGKKGQFSVKEIK